MVNVVIVWLMYFYDNDNDDNILKADPDGKRLSKHVTVFSHTFFHFNNSLGNSKLSVLLNVQSQKS